MGLLASAASRAALSLGADVHKACRGNHMSKKTPNKKTSKKVNPPVVERELTASELEAVAGGVQGVRGGVRGGISEGVRGKTGDDAETGPT